LKALVVHVHFEKNAEKDAILQLETADFFGKSSTMS